MLNRHRNPPRPMFLSSLFPSALTRAAAATVTTVTLAAVTLPSAAAATDPTLSFDDLGIAREVNLPGRVATTTVTLPVPTGLTPATLRGSLQVPAAFSRGVLEVLQDGRVLGRTTVTGGDGTTTTPVRIPLTGVDTVGTAATVDLRTTLVPVDDGWCHDPLDSVTSTLRQASVSYSGTSGAPGTLAEALPPVLRELTVTVPEDPDDDVIAAALETVTAVSAAYRTQSPTIRVVSSGVTDGVTGDAAFVRHIDIPGDDRSGVTLDNPGGDDARITLHGTGDALLDQVGLLAATDPMAPSATGDLAGMLDSTGAVSLGVPVELAPEARTLGDLDLGDLTSSGPGTARVSFGIDQGSLGRYVDAVDLHLTGSLTPLPADTPGELTVAVNGTVVDRVSTTEDKRLAAGTLDREVSIPDDILTRYSTVTVTVAGSGTQNCGTTAPLTLRIDRDSVVDSTEADAPTGLTHGFQALPQAFMPEVDVALTTGDVPDVNRAAQILAGLQSVAGTRFRPMVADLEGVVDSDRPALIIDADGTATAGMADDLDLPVRFSDGVLSVDGAQAGTDTSFGALQTSWDPEHHRMRVVAHSTGDPALLDRLLGSLGDETDTGQGTGYSRLTGTAVAQQATGDPREVGVPGPGTHRDPDGSDSSDSSGIGTSAVIAGIAAVVALVALLLAVPGIRSRTLGRTGGAGDTGSADGTEPHRDER